jgi:DNA polymerase elongation subunit (family B)
MHEWYYDENGIKQHHREKAPLYFFMKSEEGEYTSIYGDTLKKMSFDNWYKFRDTKEMFKSAGRELFESDVDVESRYILDNYSAKEMVPPKFDIYFIDIEVHSERGFPKAELAEHPITIITVWSTKQQRYFIFSEKTFDPTFLGPDKERAKIFIFESEQDLLKKFIGFIRKTHPDFISGYNSNGFDIPYIINRSIKLLGEEVAQKISPVNYIRKMVKKLQFGKTQEMWDIAGINCIDYLDLYKKFHQGQQESFKLGYIAKVELGETKLEFEGTLKDLYRNEWQKYVEYNVQDVNLLRKLDGRIQFMDLMIGICYNCRVPFWQYQKTTKVLDGAFISRLLLNKIVLPDVADADENEEQYIGAYVKDPDIGIFDWIVSFDATSLYPSIIMQHNISPETKVAVINEGSIQTILDALEGKEVDENELNLYATSNIKCKDLIQQIKDNKYSVSSNGVIYRHDKKGVVAAFVTEWFEKRKYHKKLMEKAMAEGNQEEAQLQKGLQQNYKILINSVYGGLGSKYFRLYDRHNALAITITGQEVLKTSMEALNNYFKETWPTTESAKKLNASSVDSVTCYGDTDSIYIHAGKVLKSINYNNTQEKTKDFLKQKIEPLFFKIIDSAMNKLMKVRMNCSDCKILFKREMIARRAAFLSKKHYVAWVLTMETKDIPEGDDHELEAKGVEMVKSSTPEIVRDYMRDYILSFLKNVDLKKSNDQISEIFKQFKTVPLEKIAKITNVNNIAEYTGPDGMPKKGTPNHVKGTIGYNNLLKTKGLEDYEPIYEGDKVKVVYIRENPWYSFNSVAFKDKLPDELGLKELVDYDIMWNKVFVDPIKQFYDIAGWEMPNLDQEDITDLFN